MGRPEWFAKQTFAEETELVTRGAMFWQAPPEIGLIKLHSVQGDGLPLREELVPFLVARSGRALEEFARWVAPRRSLEWVMSMVEYTSMSMKLTEEMLRKRFPPVKDPEILARRRLIVRVLMEEASPEEKAELLDPRVEEELIEKGIENGIEKGRIIEARVALRRVLARRQLALTPEQEARIDQCEEAAILERWHDQAVTAATAAEALV